MQRDLLLNRGHGWVSPIKPKLIINVSNSIKRSTYSIHQVTESESVCPSVHTANIPNTGQLHNSSKYSPIYSHKVCMLCCLGNCLWAYLYIVILF